ncbi:MAG: DUF2863 family protein [Burkholderiaceae bacterium]|nr:DUF2863 family protein [Burkholderiaceae bacterium]
MKEPRIARSGRDRKTHLSPDAERLVMAALGLANSGSRVEDRFWEQQLAARIDKLLDGAHPRALHDALERLNQTDAEAYGALIEAVEEGSESLVIEEGDTLWQVLLVSAPIVAWTRFRIPSGPISLETTDALALQWRSHVLAREARFTMLPYLLSLDQLPRDHAELRRLTRRLGNAAIRSTRARLDQKSLPETADMLADTRFLIGALAVPLGRPAFRWQEDEPQEHASRVQCLESWVAQGRPSLEPMLPGCGFECLLPDAYHINLRESDRRARPYAIRAGVHFLTHALGVEASAIRAVVAPFGTERIDEYRIGLSVDNDDEEVAHGIVWPLLGAESEDDDPTPFERIRETLRDVGVMDLRTWSETTEPEFCEDCGVPLFPNGKGEVVHAEMPMDVEPESTHFH